MALPCTNNIFWIAVFYAKNTTIPTGSCLIFVCKDDKTMQLTKFKMKKDKMLKMTSEVDHLLELCGVCRICVDDFFPRIVVGWFPF